MKVEEACRLSVDGTAKTQIRIKTTNGSILDVSLYAKYNEVQEQYTVTPYYKRHKITTAKQLINPHRFERWSPSRRFACDGKPRQPAKTRHCLYMLVSKRRYQFLVGLTENIYSRVYQLRLIYGEFDLDTSCIVYASERYLKELEKLLHFVFEEYHLGKSTLLEGEQRNWFDLDCYWYAKNEIRRLNSFREDKIYRVFEGIDLNTYLVEDCNLAFEDATILDDGYPN